MEVKQPTEEETGAQENGRRRKVMKQQLRNDEMNAKEVTNPIDMAPVTSEDGENENNKAAAENERVDDMEQKDQDALQQGDDGIVESFKSSKTEMDKTKGGDEIEEIQKAISETTKYNSKIQDQTEGSDEQFKAESSEGPRRAWSLNSLTLS